VKEKEIRLTRKKSIDKISKQGIGKRKTREKNLTLQEKNYYS
jgi:hypothetical protein